MQVIKPGNHRLFENDPETAASVSRMLLELEREGMDAVRRYSQTFDDWNPRSFQLTGAEISEAISQVPEQAIRDTEYCQDNVRRFAQAQLATMLRLKWNSNGTGTTLNDSHNLRYDWGILGYDLPRKTVISTIYRLPQFRSVFAPVRPVIGGWTLSSLVNVRGGYPFTVGVSGPTLNNGAGTNRANLVGNPNLPSDQRTYDRWINPAAFTAPPNYVWGNQGKNMLRGPVFAQTDVSVQKRFPISETKRFVLRADSQNVFNRVQLGMPISRFGANGFGAIRSLAGGPRNVQLALRFEF